MQLAERAAAVRAAFAQEYVSDDGRLAGGTPRPLCDCARVPTWFQNHVRARRPRNWPVLWRLGGRRLDTGFLSTPYLLDVLWDAGYREIARDLLWQTSDAVMALSGGPWSHHSSGRRRDAVRSGGKPARCFAEPLRERQRRRLALPAHRGNPVDRTWLRQCPHRTGHGLRSLRTPPQRSAPPQGPAIRELDPHSRVHRHRRRDPLRNRCSLGNPVGTHTAPARGPALIAQQGMHTTSVPPGSRSGPNAQSPAPFLCCRERPGDAWVLGGV